MSDVCLLGSYGTVVQPSDDVPAATLLPVFSGNHPCVVSSLDPANSKLQTAHGQDPALNMPRRDIRKPVRTTTNVGSSIFYLLG
jgi:hypothetical protein